MIDAALYYASKGWKVFPLTQGTKIPAEGMHWIDEATLDEGTITQWWGTNPTSNIAIATGRTSNLTVIDVDGHEGWDSIKEVIGEFPKERTRVIKTPRGYHLYYEYHPDFHTGAGFLAGVDVRSDGGYVVAPPSVVNGTRYAVAPDRDKPPIPITYAPEIFKARNRNGVTADPVLEHPTWVSDLLANGVAEGLRDQSATSLAGYFHSRGLPDDIIETIMLPFSDKCIPAFDLRDLRKVIQSVSRYEVPDTIQIDDSASLSEEIRKWVVESNGKWWNVDELDNQFGIREVTKKNNRRQILHRMRSDGFIEQHQGCNKRDRYRVRQLDILDFNRSGRGNVMDIRWPLGIERHVNLYAGNIAVVAGSPNSGKTALMLNLIHLNQDRFPIYYFCSEMGDNELSDRLGYFEQEGTNLDDWTFTAVTRSSDFSDVIVPDALNIIDFMELTQDIYLVNEYLKAITHAIGRGVAIIALQKKIGADLGRGQEFSLEKPRLYLSMDNNKMRIIKGKNWARKGYNPNGLFINYSIIDGYKFVATPDGWQESN